MDPSSWVMAGIAAASAIAGTATSIKANHDQKKAARKIQEAAAKTPVYNAKAEKQKAANQEANVNRKRILAETDTVKTSALGNTTGTQTQKKTLLGG